MSTGDRLDTLERQMSGDKSNINDSGVIGMVQNHEVELKTQREFKIKLIDLIWKVASGLILVALVATFTYLFSVIYKDNGNVSADSNNTNSNIIRHPLKHSAGGADSNNRDNRTVKYGN